ncbi:uncharacterized protein LOC123312438 [Coccinella septempunctata]|uniref:uncharacterized protein LOC123312438 n=1 Tax=Coccinella septempunctata TaxID=41139 RepID=UPI001D0642D2|nr:uncharacterized protein LOC123312438 [Coccinella septempunctata]
MSSIDNVTTLDIEVPFENSRVAEVVYHTLQVDTEPKRGGTRKNLVLEGNKLIAKFHGSNLSSLRTSVNSFFDNIHLITETIQLVGQPLSESYSHF